MIFQPTLGAPYTHIWSQDPALDTEAEGHDHERYLETGDVEFLKMKDGEEPMVWELVHLRGVALAIARNEMLSGTGALGLRTIAGLAIRGVRNALYKGAPLDLKVTKSRHGTELYEHLRPSQLAMLYDNAPHLIEELGLRVTTEDLTINPL